MVVILANEVYGWNRHIWDMELTMIVPTLKMSLGSYVSFGIATTSIKLSILGLTYRLALTQKLRKIAVASGVFITISECTFLMALFLQCRYDIPPPLSPNAHLTVQDHFGNFGLFSFKIIMVVRVLLYHGHKLDLYPAIRNWQFFYCDTNMHSVLL